MTTAEAATTRQAREIGAWRAAARGWRVVVPAVVGNAAVQALTVVADPVPATTVGFAALTLASAAALVLAVWCVVAAGVAVVDHRPAGVWSTIRHRPAVAAWTVVVGVVAVAASLLAVWLLPVVLVVGAFLLPPAASGRPAPAAAWAAVRLRPGRCLLLVVVALVLAAVSVVVALVLGLFVTGWLSAGLLWVWLGLVGTVVLCRYCVVTRPGPLAA